MTTTNENDALHSNRPSRFWNVPRISIALGLLGIISLAATRRISHPALVVAGATLAFLLFAAYFWWDGRRRESSRVSTSLILGGVVFLAGALYGAIEVAVGEADKLDLVALIVPASLGTWLVRKGLIMGRLHRDDRTSRRVARTLNGK
jgi:hypothetical protein